MYVSKSPREIYRLQVERISSISWRAQYSLIYRILKGGLDHGILTDTDAFPAGRRQDESDDWQNREDTAWQNEVDDVVERLAS